MFRNLFKTRLDFIKASSGKSIIMMCWFGVGCKNKNRVLLWDIL